MRKNAGGRTEAAEKLPQMDCTAAAGNPPQIDSRLQRVSHEFAPVYDQASRVLILGTFPSVKSREQNFYYGHPQNRFWKVIAELCGSPLPVTIEEKKTLLLTNGIAVWDVIASCEIQGSSDSSIRNVVPNDIGGLIRKSRISQIYANGDKAYQLYQKYCRETAGMDAIRLPSTSPANAAWSPERLREAWSVILAGTTEQTQNSDRGTSCRQNK